MSVGWCTCEPLMLIDMSSSNANMKKKPFYKSPNFRLSLSLSTILLLYRLLFRFLTRLRVHLLNPQVEPFRRRNPRTAATLTSPYAPAIGASLAGLAMGIYPSQQLRVTLAIYAMFRALEFGWNVCEMEGMIWGTGPGGRKRERPWWFGSWMLQPLAFGQLLHAAVFDRDCFPTVSLPPETQYTRHSNSGNSPLAIWSLETRPCTCSNGPTRGQRVSSGLALTKSLTASVRWLV